MLQQYMTDHAHSPGLADDLLPLSILEHTPGYTLPAGMEERILRPVIGVTPTQATNKKSPTLLYYLKRACVAAILLGICLLMYQRFSPAPSPHLAVTLQMDSVSTAKGTSKVVLLPDGTRIRLNGGTTLRYPAVFSENKREVYLNGEAFFEVNKDLDHPFIIHAATFTTTVLGTSFNIRSAGKQDLAEVAVATGKVQVAITGQPSQDAITLLTPGEKATYHSGHSTGWKKSQTPIASIGAWRNREFIYDQTPLSIILSDLENAYGLNFQVKNNRVLSCTYSVKFKQMTAKQIMATLALMSEVRFLTKDSLIEVSGNSCN
nr:FecR domain-containing protein [Chitinophaga nivalis]